MTDQDTRPHPPRPQVPTPKELLRESVKQRTHELAQRMERGERPSLSFLYRYLGEAYTADAPAENISTDHVVQVLAHHDVPSDTQEHGDLDELLYMLSIRMVFVRFAGYTVEGLPPMETLLERAQRTADSLDASILLHTRASFWTTYSQLASLVFEYTRAIDRDRLLGHIVTLDQDMREHGKQMFEEGVFSELQQASNRLRGVANLALEAPEQLSQDSTPEETSEAVARAPVRLGGVAGSIWNRGPNRVQERARAGADTGEPEKFYDFEHPLYETEDGSFQVKLTFVTQDHRVLLCYRTKGTRPKSLDHLRGHLTLQFDKDGTLLKEYSGDISLDLHARVGKDHPLPGRKFRVLDALHKKGESLETVTSTFYFKLSDE